jgi:Flp pilus assembly pilin Flp
VSKLIAVIRAHVDLEDGQTLVEYGLILALVSLVAIAGLTVMGGDVVGLYAVLERLATTLVGATGI